MQRRWGKPAEQLDESHEAWSLEADYLALGLANVVRTGEHVTVVASSGDTGAISDDGPPRQVSMPASDPLVLAVGRGVHARAYGR